MSAKHALLRVLIEKPRRPSQAAARIEQLLGSAWRLNTGQLSHLVKVLLQTGLIERLDEDDPRADDEGRILAGTAAGVEEVERWFAEPMSWARSPRRPWLVKLLLAGPDRLDVPLEELNKHEEECTARLKGLSRELEVIPSGELQVRAEHELLRFALSAEIRSEEGELQWVRYMQDRILRLKRQDVIWPSMPPRPPTTRMQGRRDARDRLFDRIAEGRGPTVPRTRNDDEADIA